MTLLRGSRSRRAGGDDRGLQRIMPLHSPGMGDSRGYDGVYVVEDVDAGRVSVGEEIGLEIEDFESMRTSQTRAVVKDIDPDGGEPGRSLLFVDYVGKRPARGMTARGSWSRIHSGASQRPLSRKGQG